MSALYFYHLLKGKPDHIPAIKGINQYRVMKPLHPRNIPKGRSQGGITQAEQTFGVSAICSDRLVASQG